MAIALSQQDYWGLLSQTDPVKSQSAGLDVTWNYPKILGSGSVRQIQLREGLDLAIADYHPRDRLILHCPEREHPLEYSFFLSGEFQDQSGVISAGQYALYGSGIAPQEQSEWLSSEPVLEVNVHINPALFATVWNQAATELQPALQHLIRANSQPYYCRSGFTTPAMQMVLQQILQCPFTDLLQGMYLESKVWELLALLLAQEVEQNETAATPALKRDDVDRIHDAREILLQRLDNPPSLLELARQVGLNDCTLKRGFRQVFGTTAFGYLHDYRLEQARQLLEAGGLNVAEVSRQIGFGSRSHFAAAFRKKFGITPKAYRVNCRNSA